MSYRCFEVSIAEKVAHVVFSRPGELNTMVPDFWRELPAIVEELSASGTVRALVLSSTGRHFTAGMDLSVFTGGMLASSGPDGTDAPEAGRRQANLRLTVLALQAALSTLERARMPVLAAIQGGCIGGGLDLASACDVRYASEEAFFCVQETNLGMTADGGTLQRLPKIVPEGVVRELVFTGRRMSAARAYQVGLVNEVFPDHPALVAGVLEIAAAIAAKSPLAIWGSKQMLGYARDHTVADGLDYVATWQAGALQPADVLESLQARVDQRQPSYADLPPTPRGL